MRTYALTMALILTALIAFTAFAAAESAAPGTAALTAAALTPDPGTAATAPAPEVGDLLGGLVKVLGDWRVAGWMSGMAALAGLIGLLLQFPPVAALFKRLPPWVKPVAIAGASSLVGFFTALPGGIVAAALGALGGVGAGLSAVGGHNVFQRFTPSGAAEVSVMRTLHTALASGDEAAVAAGDALKAGILEAKKGATPGSRMKALAAALGGAK